MYGIAINSASYTKLQNALSDLVSLQATDA